MGCDQPCPGTSTRQATFSPSLQRSGIAAAGTTPFPAGPRNWGQSPDEKASTRRESIAPFDEDALGMAIHAHLRSGESHVSSAAERSGMHGRTRARLAAVLLGLAMAGLVIAGFAYWHLSYVSGQETCVRCGVHRAVDRRGPFWYRSAPYVSRYTARPEHLPAEC